MTLTDPLSLLTGDSEVSGPSCAIPHITVIEQGQPRQGYGGRGLGGPKQEGHHVDSGDDPILPPGCSPEFRLLVVKNGIPDKTN